MIEYPMPDAQALRHVHPWRFERPKAPSPRRVVAVHEAGHVVVMRHFGMPSPRAELVQDDAGARGQAHWPERQFFAELPQPGPDEDGRLTATAGAVFAAGWAAEMIDAGEPFTGPLWLPAAADFADLQKLLMPAFGPHCAGAHAFALRYALHVLSERWCEVQAIADELHARGEWASGRAAPA